jgi:hypothetical protein
MCAYVALCYILGMRRRLVVLALGLFATTGIGIASMASASAASTPVKVGRDGCGNTQVWVNGQPLFQYVMCMPPTES